MAVQKNTRKPKEPSKVLDFLNSTLGVAISIITAIGIGVSIGFYARGQQAQIDKLQNDLECEKKIQDEKAQYRELETRLNKEKVDELTTIVNELKKQKQ